MARSYWDLLVWHKAELLPSYTKQTESFPKSETYGLSSQNRRPAVLVSSNIAEGQGRLTQANLHTSSVWREGRFSSSKRNSRSHSTSDSSAVRPWRSWIMRAIRCSA